MKVFQNYSPTTIDALNEAVTISVSDCDGFAFQITGTFTATLSFEVSMNGTDWVAMVMFTTGSGSPITTASAAGIYRAAPFNTFGLEFARVRVSAYTDGAANVIWQTARVSK